MNFEDGDQNLITDEIHFIKKYKIYEEKVTHAHRACEALEYRTQSKHEVLDLYIHQG